MNLWPDRDSPFWLLATLGVICTTLCFCLKVIYANGFVFDKDGLTVMITLLSGLVMPIIKMIVTRHQQ